MMPRTEEETPISPVFRGKKGRKEEGRENGRGGGRVEGGKGGKEANSTDFPRPLKFTQPFIDITSCHSAASP